MKRILSLVGTVLVMGSLYWFGGGPPDGSIEEVDLPDGPVESYYDNGELSYKGTYKDDEECGEWIEDGETVTYDPC